MLLTCPFELLFLLTVIRLAMGGPNFDTPILIAKVFFLIFFNYIFLVCG